MAKTLSAFPERHEIQRGRYPWDKWFDGQVWHLEHGSEEEVERGDRDYSTTTKSFRSAITQARKAANKRGVDGTVKTAVVKENGTEAGVVLQWVPKGTPGADEG